ncbi:Protein RGF1 INDUCIBLE TRANSCRIPTION FACTOR 1 [Linum perenne]
MVGCGGLYDFKNDDGGNPRRRSWVETLLKIEFFRECENHRELRKNERNVFCLDCGVGFCRHCLKSDSCFHRHLQICKYVYHDVIRLQDIQKYLDCSRIQTYKINGEKAVHLNPRPVAKDAKPSTKAKFGAACNVCGRYLQDLPNRFCSIACKVSGGGPCMLEGQRAPLSGNEAPITPFKLTNVGSCEYDNGSALTETESDGEEEGRETEWLTPSPLLTGNWRRRSHQRKGVPFRSPFC